MVITVEELNKAYEQIHEMDKNNEITRGFLVELENGLWFSFKEELGPRGSWLMVSPDVIVRDLD